MAVRSSARAAAGLLLLLLLVGLPGTAVAATAGEEEVHLVVRHRPGAASATAGLVRAGGGRTVAAIPQIATQTVAVDADEAAALSAALAEDPRIADVRPDVAVHALASTGRTPDDLHWLQQWGPERVRARSAWLRSVGDAGVVIAVLDTGVSQVHPDLEPNVVSPGYDAIARRPVTVAGDVHGHGSHVAGIAAAATDNGRGIAGLCWGCRILPVKVLDDTGSGRFSDIEAGIVWAADNGADVIVMSLGTSAADSTTAPSGSAVAYAAGKGVLLVAAAGNEGTTGKVWPAAFPEVIGVAASDPSDARAEYSNHGSWVDVAAPGSGILSTVPGGYALLSGTSMAAPHVAGALGLALSRAPDLDAAALRAALLATAAPVGDYVAAGRLDAEALLAAVEQAPTAPTEVTASAGDGRASVSWRAPASAGGAPLTHYAVTASPGGATAQVPASDTTTTVAGLTNGTAYRFTVTAVNERASSAASEPSEPVTPRTARPWAFDGSAATSKRVAEDDPVRAAVAVSLRRFAAAGETSGPRAAHAVLSRDDAFPDSLAGAPLSATGPLLFTPPGTLASATAAELKRALPPGATVYLLGGEAALSAGVVAQVRALGFAPVRLAGAARVETSLRIAQEVRRLYPGDRSLLVARAYGAPGEETSGWADSVTGGAYGAAARVPVVLTPTASVHPALRTWVQADAPSRTVLLGGAGALSEAVRTALPRSQRIAGAERTATAAIVAARLWGAEPSGARRFVVINGFHRSGWAHGLAAAGAAADADAPLLLVTPRVPAATQELVGACGTPQVELFLVGGSSAIPYETAAELDRLDGGSC